MNHPVYNFDRTDDPRYVAADYVERARSEFGSVVRHFHPANTACLRSNASGSSGLKFIARAFGGAAGHRSADVRAKTPRGNAAQMDREMRSDTTRMFRSGAASAPRQTDFESVPQFCTPSRRGLARCSTSRIHSNVLVVLSVGFTVSDFDRS